MRYLIVIDGIITNIIITNIAFAEEIGALPYYDGAKIGDNYSPPVSLNTARANALQRIEGKCSAAIESGVTVDGVHYPLTRGTAQDDLNEAVALANSGETAIPYGPYGGALSIYTSAQILKINKAKYEWGLANRIYKALIPVWVQQEENSSILNGFDYGKALPSDWMTELTKQLTDAGIDATLLTSKLSA